MSQGLGLDWSARLASWAGGNPSFGAYEIRTRLSPLVHSRIRRKRAVRSDLGLLDAGRPAHGGGSVAGPRKFPWFRDDPWLNRSRSRRAVPSFGSPRLNLTCEVTVRSSCGS